jgi:hypothetical protein
MSRIRTKTGFPYWQICFVSYFQDCVHQQAGQAGGGRLHDSDVNDAAAGDSSASHPDTAGPGSHVRSSPALFCIPTGKMYSGFDLSNFSRSYLQTLS